MTHVETKRATENPLWKLLDEAGVPTPLSWWGPGTQPVQPHPFDELEQTSRCAALRDYWNTLFGAFTPATGAPSAPYYTYLYWASQADRGYHDLNQAQLTAAVAGLKRLNGFMAKFAQQLKFAPDPCGLAFALPG